MPIEALKLIQAVTPKAAVAAPATTTDPGGFGDKLTALISNIEDKSADANQAITNMVNKTGDVHDAMIALQRAEMSLQMTVQVRNKLMAAYNEIMRMPV